MDNTEDDFLLNESRQTDGAPNVTCCVFLFTLREFQFYFIENENKKKTRKAETKKKSKHTKHCV